MTSSSLVTYLLKPLYKIETILPALSSTLLFGLSFDHAFVTLPPLSYLAPESVDRAFRIFLANSLPLLALTSGATFLTGTRAAFGAPSNSWSRFFYAAGTSVLFIRLACSTFFSQPLKKLMDNEGDPKKNLRDWLVVQRVVSMSDLTMLGLFITAFLK